MDKGEFEAVLKEGGPLNPPVTKANECRDTKTRSLVEMQHLVELMTTGTDKADAELGFTNTLKGWTLVGSRGNISLNEANTATEVNLRKGDTFVINCGDAQHSYAYRNLTSKCRASRKTLRVRKLLREA